MVDAAGWTRGVDGVAAEVAEIAGVAGADGTGQRRVRISGGRVGHVGRRDAAPRRGGSGAQAERVRRKVQVFRELLALGKGGDALALDAGPRRRRGERLFGSRVVAQVQRDVVDGEAWCAISLIR